LSFSSLRKRFYKVPSRVQDIVNIDRIDLDTGVFYHGKGIYTKQYEFTDVNYDVVSDEDKYVIFTKYGQLINSFSTGSEFKITMNNHRIDEAVLQQSALMSMQDDGYDDLRNELNSNVREKLAQSNNIDTQLVLTLRVDARDFDDAAMQLSQLEKSCRSKLNEIGSDMLELSVEERLRVLYNIYRCGEEPFYSFDPHKGFYMHDFKDYICPDNVEVFPDYLKLGDKFVRTLFVKDYGNIINDNVLYSTLNIPKTACLSIDVKVMAPTEAKDLLEKHLFNVSGDITKWQMSQNKHDNYTAEIPYDLKRPRDEAEEQLADLVERDQNLCYTWVSLMLMADTLEELDSDTALIISNGHKNNLQLYVPRKVQIEAMNAAIPLGVNLNLQSRLLMTECLATLMPFRTQNIMHKDGIYYGVNPLSKKLLMVNKDNLPNQNSFVLGSAGTGKSFVTKSEIMSLVLRGDTDVIIIDPESEYGSLVKALGGEVVVLDAAQDTYINALDLSQEYASDSSNPIAVKSDFVMSLVARINGGALTAEESSIIDRCLSQVYKPYIRSGFKGTPPTLVDFKSVLEGQGDSISARLALSIELFASGSLNLFAKQSNVNVNSRLVSYDILNLGRNLKPLAMLVTLDSIFNRMAKNRKIGRKTAIFIDEIYLLFQDPYSEQYLMNLWKRCRKYGGSMTGITQNIEDLLASDNARRMLNNSEFLIILSQNGTDRAELAKLLSISEVQLPFISTGQPGEGLLKVGKAIVPFENKYRTDTKVYSLLTSKLSDLVPSPGRAEREVEDITDDAPGGEDGLGDTVPNEPVSEEEAPEERVSENMVSEQTDADAPATEETPGDGYTEYSEPEQADAETGTDGGDELRDLLNDAF